MWIRRIAGVVLLIVGIVWIGQGVGVIGGSFMTGESVWAVIGAFTVLVALTLLRGARRDRNTRRDEI